MTRFDKRREQVFEHKLFLGGNATTLIICSKVKHSSLLSVVRAASTAKTAKSNMVSNPSIGLLQWTSVGTENLTALTLSQLNNNIQTSGMQVRGER